jgi:hypothetical protein
MNKTLTLLFATLSLFIISCQKEITLADPGTPNGSNPTGTGGGNSNLVGTWNFVNVRSVTFASNETTAAGVTDRTETTSDYTTINNSGTVVFTAQAMNNNNVAYAINSTSFNKLFTNGVLVDTFTAPLVASIPPTSSSTTYTTISADSIVVVGTSVGGQPATPYGTKLRLSNDTLFLMQSLNEVGVQTVQGLTYNTVRKALVTTTLKKKP